MSGADLEGIVCVALLQLELVQRCWIHWSWWTKATRSLHRSFDPHTTVNPIPNRQTTPSSRFRTNKQILDLEWVEELERVDSDSVQLCLEVGRKRFVLHPNNSTPRSSPTPIQVHFRHVRNRVGVVVGQTLGVSLKMKLQATQAKTVA